MLRIIESVQEIEKKILRALAEDYNKAINKSIKTIRTRIKEQTRPFFVESEFYRSLSGGLLAAHFGFPKDGAMRIEKIVDAVLNALVVDYTLASSRSNPTITIRIIGEDLKEIFSLPDSIITVDNDGQVLPWIDWILNRSTDIIIRNFEIEFGSFPNSRSGKAIMEFEEGGIWSVPAEFAGTIGDNIVTRALFNNLDQYLRMISNVVREELERNII